MPKEIIVVLDDNLIEKMKTEIGLKKMTGSCYTLTDLFILRLIQAIDAGEKELALKLIEKKKEDAIKNENKNNR